MFKKITIILSSCALFLCVGNTYSYSQSKIVLSPKTEKAISEYKKDSTWLVSRLQMYWETHYTDIYVKGENYSHGKGSAPVPTVRYSASRSTISPYNRPLLEEIVPYQDTKGMWMQERSSGKMIWADPAKTGRNIESINNEILTIAKEAAQFYAEHPLHPIEYAKMAFSVFDCYMNGIYWRNVPIDLNHGHQQTLVGLTSFEVIHENAVGPATECYESLKEYIKHNYPERVAIYDNAFKKWADNIIDNGVPHNNWNLFQANFIIRIASILSSNSYYSDTKGKEYYLYKALDDDSIRQWSMKKLIDFGFDHKTGLWKESPGYATTVLKDFVTTNELVKKCCGRDLLEEFPLIKKGIRNSVEYLFPNGLRVNWGDGYYSPLDNSIFRKVDVGVNPDSLKNYVSDIFYSEGASWLAARSGMDPQTDLMFSVCGSDGNHQHANGISVEFYGKGYVMGPDLGHGSSYTSLDYSEFYSQFPAHNTVCVDGISSYPVMKSCHPLVLIDSLNCENFIYADLYFLEPETQSDQRRQLAIIKTNSQQKYYVDIFRSARRDGKDVMHDYFYHNIGQSMTLNVLTEPTEDLCFAGAHLYAYSYLWNKSEAKTDKDIKVDFQMHVDSTKTIGMNMWMKGEGDRKIFKAYSPKITALTRTNMPYDVANSPCLTFIARQYGEAWNNPFIAIYEPYDSKDGTSISDVEFLQLHDGRSKFIIKITRTNGDIDYIFSSDKEERFKIDGIKTKTVFDVISVKH